ncbi:MAG: hypothetical protein FWF54_06110 [Candidatus Azobacteroides sp.]|nr:hypothetical protein [Candidatus Azobacteroides sp.]
MKKVLVSIMLVAAIALSGTISAQDTGKKCTADKQKTECTKDKKDKKECCSKDKKNKKADCCKKSEKCCAKDSKSSDKQE